MNQNNKEFHFSSYRLGISRYHFFYPSMKGNLLYPKQQYPSVYSLVSGWILFLFLISAQNKSKEALYLILTEETFYFFCINPLNAVG